MIIVSISDCYFFQDSLVVGFVARKFHPGSHEGVPCQSRGHQGLFSMSWYTQTSTHFTSMLLFHLNFIKIE